nr:PREDICTED: zinc finger protein 541 [Apteryx mantelli mantelli]
MDQYRFGEENAVHSEMQLSGFSETQGLSCSDALNHDSRLNTKDMAYAGLSGLDMVPGLSAADLASDALEANLNGLSLYSVKDCDSVKLLDESDSDSQPSLRELGLPTLTGSKEVEQGGRSNSGTARKGKHQHSSPQASFLDCSLCGKVFSSASSLSKHYLTHSQERKHVCRICSKAFKRQGHLSGHMLTHQKTKPFMCLEKGCAKSYCDHRSLRRHYEVQHGLCILKETPDEDGEPQFPLEPTGLEYCPNSALPYFPIFRGQKTSANAHQSSGNFQWMRNVPVCAKNKRNSVCVAHKPSLVAQDVSEGSAGPSHTFSAFPQTYECPDALSFTVAPFKEEEALGDSVLSCSEETFRSARSHDSHPWENCGELNFQDIQKQNAFQNESSPLVRQLFMKSQESVVSQEQVQVQQHLFQMITKSQHVLSHTQMAPSQLVTSEAKHVAPKPLQTVFQQPPRLTHHLPEPTEYEGSSTYLQKSITQFQKDVLSDNEKRGLQTVPTFQSLQPGPLKEYIGLKDASIPSQLQPAMHDNAMGYHSYGKSNQLENKTSISNRKEKSKGCSKETGGKTQMSVGRSRCLPGIRKEKLKFDVTCAASPSQVAMASFSSSGTSSAPVFREKPRLTIFNRIQGGNIYSLTNTVKEESFSAGCNKTSGVPTDGGKYESGFLCKNCSQLFYTEKGLESHMCFHGEQWYPPERQEEQQVNEKESQDATDLKESLHQKKRKRQTRPKSLFIPPPSSFEVQPGSGGCYQSNLRSPVFLIDHLLRDLFQCSPYTPPPMLSPIREGSGLYFSTLCSSANGDPNQLFSTVLDRMDRDFGFSLVKDNTKISVEPHINIGSRFQAEIPNLRDRSYLENDEQAASLVWKPWGDIATNQETQDRVTELLNMACSSVMPGGGTNLELALHCLHEAQGNVLEALEMLLFGGPQKSESHPLANYRYAGSDIWTPLERQLFKKAFCIHKKDFYLIQKKIQTKNVSQCVEYYYIWKKIIKFDCSRVQVIEKKVKKDKNELEKTEEKTACSPPKRHSYLPKEGMKIEQKSYKKMPHSTWSPSCSPKGSPYQAGSTDDQCAFPCRECERVFDKIKSRNAHMKCHRLQEQVEPLMKIKWPLKHFKNEAKMEETQTLTSSSGNWETPVSE